MDEKLIIGVVSAIGGGIFALLTTYMSGRFKMRQLEFERMLQDSRTRLAAANKKIDDVYIPMVSEVEQCYRNWYLHKESKEDAKKQSFIDSIDKLSRLYLNMIETGSIIYLVPETREELERLIRFLESSKEATTWKILVLRRMEGVGIRSITETVVDQKKLLIAVMQLLTMRIFFNITKRFTSAWLRINIELRTASAPIDSIAFAEEFNRIIDIIRHFSAQIALYKDIAKTEKAPETKSAEQKNTADT